MRSWLALCLALSLVSGCSGAAGAEAQVKRKIAEVKAKEYRFTSARIEVPKGAQVTLRMRNMGTERHEWELPGYKVEIKPVPPGGSGEISFVADKAGTYEFFCDMEDHYERGMRGFLVVKER